MSQHEKSRYQPRHRRISSAPRFWSAIAMAAGLAAGGALLAASTAGANEAPPGAHGAYQLTARHDQGENGRGQLRQLRQLTANPDCTLKVPRDPLSAEGLATPYVLSSAGITCSETNQDTAAFVQATILDPSTGALAVYDPVVRDAGQPLLGTAPPVPSLPRDAVVTVWTGFNGNVLKLTGPGHGEFVNFAQQAYSYSPRFFRALREAESAGLVTVPGLGTSPKDGMACPSSRDFSIVDQDQSDNNTNTYPAYGVANGSDERTLNSVDKALGCTTWHVPSLSGASPESSGPLQEEQANAHQSAPVALVPGLDPFVTSGGQPDLFLQDLYRLQVGQPLTFNGNDTGAYCQNLLTTGEPRLKLDQPYDNAAPMPVVGALGVNLGLHLAARYAATWVNLGCQGFTGQASPITVTSTDGNGLATSAAYK
jgi:hypothetical protein